MPSGRIPQLSTIGLAILLCWPVMMSSVSLCWRFGCHSSDVAIGILAISQCIGVCATAIIVGCSYDNHWVLLHVYWLLVQGYWTLLFCHIWALLGMWLWLLLLLSSSVLPLVGLLVGVGVILALVLFGPGHCLDTATLLYDV